MIESKQPWSRMLSSILDQGSYLILSDFERQQQVLTLARSLIFEGVEKLNGPASRQELEQQGLSLLHNVLAAEQIGPLRDLVMPTLRPALLEMVCSIGRLLGIDDEFFVDDYTILRINFPYLVAKEASRSAENPGIGRVDESTRKQSVASKVVDPNYNPKAYHNNEPPAAWAHGAHRDTWTGHSRLGVNLWWAVDNVPEEASMVFYPGTLNADFEPDRRSLYLAEGYPLPKPVKMSLRKGEMLVFNPEVLHATHLNTTSVTRLAISARINPVRPRFSTSCFYAREFWHSSTNIEAGHFDRVLRFERNENLEPAIDRSVVPPKFPQLIELEADSHDNEWKRVCESVKIAEGGKLRVRFGNENVLLIRTSAKLHASQANCPHLGVALADGFHDEKQLFCPAHGLAFNLQSGLSSCTALRLRMYEVEERQGDIWMRATNRASVHVAA